MKYQKLTRTENPDDTKIVAGHNIVSVKDAENVNTEIGRKLKSVEKDLERY